MNKALTELAPFAKDVLEGLSAENKYLPSKYFYDARGDELFQQIMELEEYYLTRKELEIFQTQKEEIYNAISDGSPFRIIELGAGDGTKTKVLLNYFYQAGADFTYVPVDISGNVLEILQANLLEEIPGLNIHPFEGDYFDAMQDISARSERDVVFFLGSNVGNFTSDQAVQFLQKLHGFLKTGDRLFMGVDLKKDPSVILNAYNDSKGITREFNLNLLDRINRELEGNFDRHAFLHYPYYNPQTGECRSYLISKETQHIELLGEEISLDAWEAIFMEVSKKYDRRQLQKLAAVSRYREKAIFTDQQRWFADVLWEK